MMKPVPQERDERLLRVNHVLEVVNLSRAKLYDLIAQGDFPAPVKIGKVACWPASWVQAWIAEKMAEADREGQRVHEVPAK